MSKKRKKAIIIGAGPAGLTAAHELLKRTDILPIILEMSNDIGGISKTVNYKGNRMDIGGHRFFSKSDRVMNWWLNLFPIDAEENQESVTISYQHQGRAVGGAGSSSEPGKIKDPDKVMLVRKRLSRIYFLRKFFSYPVQPSLDTLKKLGLVRTASILLSYIQARLFPRKPEKSLEDFLINRFGNKLYLLFFKDYTEKVWGVPCTRISPEWGAQRIKGISIGKAIAHAVKSLYPNKSAEAGNIGQKGTETSLIEKFLYPKFGPGQLWEEVARQVREMGGVIFMNQEVAGIWNVGNRIKNVDTWGTITGKMDVFKADYVISTMPVQDLINGMNDVPESVMDIARGLQYRDFITVGVLLTKMPSLQEKDQEKQKKILPDTWIYIQEKDVQVGRVQIFNNWSPFMVKDPDTVWVGMEYFCDAEGEFWNLSDERIQEIAIGELEKIGMAQVGDVLDSTVVRMDKAYPAYFGSYDRFDEVRAFTDHFENLFLVGRNGMHKYNNSDHSMLTAMVAVDNICQGVTTKDNIWAVNTEQEYHEEKKEPSPSQPRPRPIPSTPEDALPSFPDFIFRKNGSVLTCAIGILLLEFIGFKLLYPFPNFIFDSHVYLDTASRNLDINLWPVGYPKFLRAVNWFTHSDSVLVFIQFGLLESAALYLYFTLVYFLRPEKASRGIMLGFLLVNPAYLSISNYILSDALFTALSLAWFAQLFWLLYRPRVSVVLANAILLSVLFTIRHNALYYPLITAAVVLYTRLGWKVKLIGLGLAVLLIGAYVQHDMNKYRELTGTRQLSAFAGWQLASNAMFMYRNIDHATDKDLPARLARLNTLTVNELDSFNRMKVRPDSVRQIYYLWNDGSPLKRYQAAVWQKDSTTPYLIRWATMGPLYGEYGRYLIKKHPMAFARYYLFQNLTWFAAPPVEMLGTYNLGRDTVGPLERSWFDYDTKVVRHSSNKDILLIDTIYPFAGSVITLMFVCGMVGFFVFNGWQNASDSFKKALRLVIGLWVVNLVFSVFVAPITLRYQLFMFFVSICFGSMLMEYVYNLERHPVIGMAVPGYLKPVAGTA